MDNGQFGQRPNQGSFLQYASPFFRTNRFIEMEENKKWNEITNDAKKTTVRITKIQGI